MRIHPQVVWAFHAKEHHEAACARMEFTAYLQGHCTPDSDIIGAEIVFAELISNAFRHGVAPVRIWVVCQVPNCTLNVHDGGDGFELGTPDLPSDALSEDGRGLFLICTLAREVRVVRGPHAGSTVKAVLPVCIAA